MPFIHRGNLAGKGMEAGGGGTICGLQTDCKSVRTSSNSVFVIFVEKKTVTKKIVI